MFFSVDFLCSLVVLMMSNRVIQNLRERIENPQTEKKSQVKTEIRKTKDRNYRMEREDEKLNLDRQMPSLTGCRGKDCYISNLHTHTQRRHHEHRRMKSTHMRQSALISLSRHLPLGGKVIYKWSRRASKLHQWVHGGYCSSRCASRLGGRYRQPDARVWSNLAECMDSAVILH